MAEVSIEQVSRKVRELYNKAFSAVERGNLDYAVDMFLAVLDMEPRLLIARRYLRIAELKKLKGKKTNHSVSSLFGGIKVMGAKGALKKAPLKALRMAEDLLKKDPANIQFVKLLDEAAVAANMPEVAVQTWEMMREFYPQDIDLLNRLGALYISMDEPMKGRDCLEVVTNLRPKDQQAQKALKDASALATLKKGNWEKEGSFRDKMKDSREAERLEQQAKAVKSVVDIPSMINELQQKISQEPSNINHYRSMADLYAKSKNYEKAINVLNQAQQQSEVPDPQVDLAISTYRIKQYDQEIEQLQAAGRAEEAAAKEVERHEFQINNARECVARYPNDLQFAFTYGELLFEQDDLNNAIQQFQRAQRNPQRRTRSLYYLALCFEKKGQLDIALEQLKKAASEMQGMDESKKDVLYAMGALYEQMGQKEQAVESYKEIYSVDIGFKDVAERIERAYRK